MDAAEVAPGKTEPAKNRQLLRRQLPKVRCATIATPRLPLALVRQPVADHNAGNRAFAKKSYHRCREQKHVPDQGHATEAASLHVALQLITLARVVPDLGNDEFRTTLDLLLELQQLRDDLVLM